MWTITPNACPTRPARSPCTECAGSGGELVPPSEHVLPAAVVTSERLAVHPLVDCRSRVSLHHPDGAFERHAELPAHSSVTGLGGHHSTPDLFLTVETFTRPAAS